MIIMRGTCASPQRITPNSCRSSSSSAAAVGKVQESSSRSSSSHKTVVVAKRGKQLRKMRNSSVAKVVAFPSGDNDAPHTHHNRNRTMIQHRYTDHYHDPILGNKKGSTSTSNDNLHNCTIQFKGCLVPGKASGPQRGGVSMPFPEKLHHLLTQVEMEDLGHIISWKAHGRAFQIHRKREFMELVMPLYFNQKFLTSFQRQLNLYGFNRISAGEDRGSYYHELFLRGRRDLCLRMVRTRVKGNGTKPASSPATEPDFYSMEYCVENNSNPSATDQAAASWQASTSSLPSLPHPSLREQQDDENDLSEHSPQGQHPSEQVHQRPRRVSDACAMQQQQPRSISRQDTASVEELVRSATPSMTEEEQQQQQQHTMYDDDDDDDDDERMPALPAAVASGDTTSCMTTDESMDPILTLDSVVMDTTSSSAPPTTSSSSCSTMPPPPPPPMTTAWVPSACLLHSGDEVYFEGHKFHYIDHFSLQDIAETYPSQSASV